jgi:hypothetical protein
LDKDTLSKILNYPDLYNFKWEPISDVLEFITLEEKENKQYPTKETSEQPLGKKKPKNSIPNNQINEVNTPKATLTPNNEIDTIIVNAIDSWDEKEMERIWELINETFKKRKAFFKHYWRTSSTTNKSSGTWCWTTLNKFLNRYLNKFIKTYSNESYSDYLRRISNISFEDFNEIWIDERIKEFNNTPWIFFAKLQDLEECLIIYGRIHKLKLESLITNYGGLLSDFKTLFERKA